MRVLADHEPVERERLDLVRRESWSRCGEASARSSARQPFAVFVNLDAELRVDALGGREAVAAQVARRPVLRESRRGRDRARHRIRRTRSSRRRTAARAPRRRGTSAPPRGRSRAWRRGRTSRSRWPSARADRPAHQRVPTATARASAAIERAPIRVRAGTGVVPASRQPRGAPEPRETGGCRASCAKGVCQPDRRGPRRSDARIRPPAAARRTRATGDATRARRASSRRSPPRRFAHRSRWRSGCRAACRRRRTPLDRRRDRRAAPDRAHARQ